MKKFASKEQENRVQNLAGNDKTKEQKPQRRSYEDLNTGKRETGKREQRR